MVIHSDANKKKKYPGELLKGTRTLECPLTVMADSYKAGLFKMYPKAAEMSAYGEFRKPFEVDVPVKPFRYTVKRNPTTNDEI